MVNVPPDHTPILQLNPVEKGIVGRVDYSENPGYLRIPAMRIHRVALHEVHVSSPPVMGVTLCSLSLLNPII